MKVSIVDYGLGNLHSVIKALAHLGGSVETASDAEGIANAERLVLPGVGAFADGMRGLGERGQVQALRDYAASGRPLAGICLGAQLMLSEGREFGAHAGLGIIPGVVERIPDRGVKVPHVGWNRLLPANGRTWAGTPLATTPVATWTYFVHSYQMIPTDPADLLSVVRHGDHTITAAVARGRIIGFQYHPEKSGQSGLAMLREFLAW